MNEFRGQVWIFSDQISSRTASVISKEGEFLNSNKYEVKKGRLSGLMRGIPQDGKLYFVGVTEVNQCF